MTALRVKNGDPGAAGGMGDSDPNDAPWSKLEILVTTLIDAVHENTWAVLQSQTDKELPRPAPMPRPGVAKEPAHRQRKEADPRLVEWLTRRQNGEDTSDLDAELNLHNVTPMRPMTKRGGDGVRH